MIYYLVAVANGLLNTINRMVNVKAGECLGTARGAMINYIEATILAFCLVFITGKGGEFRLEHIREVPLQFYLGSICGLASMIFLIIGTKQKGAMTSTVLMLIGQLGTSVVLDYVFFGFFRPNQILGIFLILVGISWKEKLMETELTLMQAKVNEEGTE